MSSTTEECSHSFDSSMLFILCLLLKHVIEFSYFVIGIFFPVCACVRIVFRLNSHFNIAKEKNTRNKLHLFCFLIEVCSGRQAKQMNTCCVVSIAMIFRGHNRFESFIRLLRNEWHCIDCCRQAKPKHAILSRKLEIKSISCHFYLLFFYAYQFFCWFYQRKKPHQIRFIKEAEAKLQNIVLCFFLFSFSVFNHV